MLIKQDIDPKQALSRIMQELRKGSADSRHPFRYVSLASFDTEKQEPNIRMLVLREVGPAGTVTLYSDSRTNKVKEIQAHQNSALLFWHDRHKVQVTMKTRTVLHHQNDKALDYWNKDVHGPAQKAYTPLVAPGSEINKPSEAYRWPDSYTNDHFCVLQCEPFELEILQLAGKEHLRLRFKRKIKEGDWQGGWIAP